MATSYDQQDPQDIFSQPGSVFHSNPMASIQTWTNEVDASYDSYHPYGVEPLQYDAGFLPDTSSVSQYGDDFSEGFSYNSSSVAPSEHEYSNAGQHRPEPYTISTRGPTSTRRESSQSVHATFDFSDSAYISTVSDMDLFPYHNDGQNLGVHIYGTCEASPVDNGLMTAISDGARSPNSSHATSDSEISNSSQESQTPARNHPLYTAAQAADGLYHCPYVHEGCGHEPRLLKCDYDKYIDSHLKPFRCPRCIDLQFSSMACLLRHEREAHEMHGHAESLCEFPPCSRSVPGSGFRRSYNCRDHMTRCHKWVDDTPLESKKKRSATSGKITKPKAKTPSKKQQIQALKEEWTARKACLEDLTHSLAPDGPHFVIGLTQIQAEVQTLKSIQNELSKLTAGRAHHG